MIDGTFCCMLMESMIRVWGEKRALNLLETLRSNDATGTRTSLKKVYLRPFSLYRDYSYPITLSHVGEPS